MNIKEIIQEELNDFGWIEDVSGYVKKLIVEFPYPKYGWDDTDEFILYTRENYPEIDTMSPLNPEESEGGIKYFIEPAPDWNNEFEFDMSWSDYDWKGWSTVQEILSKN